MKWLFKWLDNKLQQSRYDFSVPHPPKSLAVNSSEGEGIETDAMRIHLWNATGGRVVEFRRYDRQKDRSENRMYVISSNDDFAEALSRIITMETMR